MFDYKNIRVVHFEPTTACQAKCPQCARFDEHGNLNHQLVRGSITLSEFKKVMPVDFIRQLDKLYMCGTFGEPSAAYDTFEIFQYLRDVNIAIGLGMNTNGGLRTSMWWRQLGELFNQARDYVVFSIDGLEDTNLIYRRNVSWKRVMSNAQSFINAGGSAHWDMIAFEHNEHQIDECRKLALKMGFTWFRVKRSQRHEFFPINWINPPKNVQSLLDRSSDIKCEALDKTEIYLNAQGEFLPCCHIAEQLSATTRPENRDELIDRFGSTTNYHGSQGIANVVKKFDWIPETWNSKPLATCQASCGSRPKTHQWIVNEQLR